MSIVGCELLLLLLMMMIINDVSQWTVINNNNNTHTHAKRITPFFWWFMTLTSHACWFLKSTGFKSFQVAILTKTNNKQPIDHIIIHIHIIMCFDQKWCTHMLTIRMFCIRLICSMLSTDWFKIANTFQFVLIQKFHPRHTLSQILTTEKVVVVFVCCFFLICFLARVRIYFCLAV